MTRRSSFLHSPTKRLLFEVAERLGRTVGELVHGSPAHRPISSMELTEWAALYSLRAYEAEHPDVV